MPDAPTILVLALDSPDPGAFKAGLFFNTIRQHVEIGLDVYVASLEPMRDTDAAALRDLGVRPVLQQDIPRAAKPITRAVRRLMGVDNESPKDWLLHPAARHHLAESIRPRAILGLQSYQTGIVAADLSGFLGTPYASWEHLSGYQLGTPFRHSPAKMKTFLNGAHAVAGVSKSVLEAIRARYEITLPHGMVLPNPIPAGFDASPATAAPSWLDGLDGAVCFGAWTSWRNANKRLDLLLDAFEKTHAVLSHTVLILAGPVADPALEQRASAQPGVRYVGPISREHIHHLAHRVDCCCISSDYETFGLPMVEALAAGRPVISTRCGGPDDVLDDPRLGLLCPTGDVNAMSEAMLAFCARREDFDSMQIASIARDRFGEVAQAARWKALYNDMLEHSEDVR